jgi:hypothetical protein
MIPLGAETGARAPFRPAIAETRPFNFPACRYIATRPAGFHTMRAARWRGAGGRCENRADAGNDDMTKATK